MTIHVNLELTDLCNIACRMCGQAFGSKVHDQRNSYMTWEVWREAIDRLAESRDEVSLCPHWLGEPCLHPQFDRFIRYAFERNQANRLFRDFKLHTNGTLLGPERIDTILDCANDPAMAEDTFRFVHFSVDAYHPATYRRIKGFDLGARVFDNVRALLRRRKERGLRWPYVTVAFIVMPENRGEAGLFLDCWRAAFRREGSEPRVVYDWPDRLADTIYFRGLNQSDQAAADRLHREVLDELGVLALDAPGNFHEESF